MTTIAKRRITIVSFVAFLPLAENFRWLKLQNEQFYRLSDAVFNFFIQNSVELSP